MGSNHRFFGASPEVVRYGNALQALGGADINSNGVAQRLTNCLEAVYQALGGRIIARNSLVDAIFLCSGMNLGQGASFLSLRGRTGSLINAPAWGPTGITFNPTALSQYASITLPDTRTGSVALFGTGGTWTGITGTTPAVFFLGNSAGVDTACALGAQYTSDRLTGGAVQGYTRQGASINGTTATIASATVHGYYATDAQYRSLIITNDNAAAPTMNVYVDGFLSNTKNSGLFQATSTCTLLELAAQNQTGVRSQFGTMTATAVFVFNRVLTAAEALGVSRALEWLQPIQRVLIADGDSDSFMNPGPANPTPQTEWPWVATAARGGLTGRYRLSNHAWTGNQAPNLISAYPNLTRQFRPGGRFREGWYILNVGLNDISVGGANAATVYANLQTLWALARNDGFKVMACTLPLMQIYSGGQNTTRATVNTSIKAAVGLYDALVDIDLLIQNNLYAFDTNHLTEAGYSIIGKAVAQILP